MLELYRLYKLYSEFFCIRDLVDYYNRLLNIYDIESLNCELVKVNAKRSRAKRQFKYVSYLLRNFDDCSFWTFTIAPKYYNISVADFKKLLLKIMKKFDCIYFGNFDKGTLHDRLHAHILINKRIDVRLVRSYYGIGNVDVEYVHTKNDIAFTKYINKLCNHSIKESTFGRCFTNIHIKYK